MRLEILAAEDGQADRRVARLRAAGDGEEAVRILGGEFVSVGRPRAKAFPGAGERAEGRQRRPARQRRGRRRWRRGGRGRACDDPADHVLPRRDADGHPVAPRSAAVHAGAGKVRAAGAGEQGAVDQRLTQVLGHDAGAPLLGASRCRVDKVRVAPAGSGALAPERAVHDKVRPNALHDHGAVDDAQRRASSALALVRPGVVQESSHVRLAQFARARERATFGMRPRRPNIVEADRELEAGLVCAGVVERAAEAGVEGAGVRGRPDGVHVDRPARVARPVRRQVRHDRRVVGRLRRGARVALALAVGEVELHEVQEVARRPLRALGRAAAQPVVRVGRRVGQTLPAVRVRRAVFEASQAHAAVVFSRRLAVRRPVEGRAEEGNALRGRDALRMRVHEAVRVERGFGARTAVGFVDLHRPLLLQRTRMAVRGGRSIDARERERHRGRRQLPCARRVRDRQIQSRRGNVALHAIFDAGDVDSRAERARASALELGVGAVEARVVIRHALRNDRHVRPVVLRLADGERAVALAEVVHGRRWGWRWRGWVGRRRGRGGRIDDDDGRADRVVGQHGAVGQRARLTRRKLRVRRRTRHSRAVVGNLRGVHQRAVVHRNLHVVDQGLRPAPRSSIGTLDARRAARLDDATWAVAVRTVRSCAKAVGWGGMGWGGVGLVGLVRILPRVFHNRPFHVLAILRPCLSKAHRSLPVLPLPRPRRRRCASPRPQRGRTAAPRCRTRPSPRATARRRDRTATRAAQDKRRCGTWAHRTAPHRARGVAKGAPGSRSRNGRCLPRSARRGRRRCTRRSPCRSGCTR